VSPLGDRSPDPSSNKKTFLMTHRCACTLVYTLGLAIGLTLPAIARPQEPVRPGAGTQAGKGATGEEVSVAAVTAPVGYRTPDGLMLYTPAVRDELKLTANQRKTLDRIIRGREERDLAQTRAVDEVSRARLEDGDTPIDRAQANREYQHEIEVAIDAAVARMLTPVQRNRLAQISLQFDGPLAFSRDDVLRKLNVDNTQTEQLHQILFETRDEMIRASQVGVAHAKLGAWKDGKDVPVVAQADASRRAGVSGAIRANSQVRDSAMQAIAKVLRKSQMDNYARLLGEPFDVGQIHDDHAGLEANPKEKGAGAAAPVVAEKADTRRNRTRKGRAGNTAGN
jgi:hypothetical protein